jgi:hypothetical protein
VTKSERLLYLIRIMRGKKPVRLGELSGICHVSQRTIYRDLLSLGKLNVQVRADSSGYRIGRELSQYSVLTEFPQDIDLLRLSLRTSRLASHSLFKERLSSIDTRLGASDGPPAYRSRQSRIQFAEPLEIIPDTVVDFVVIPFLDALATDSLVVLVRTGGAESDPVEPRGFRLVEGQIILICRELGARDSVQILGSDILRVRVELRPKHYRKSKTG